MFNTHKLQTQSLSATNKPNLQVFQAISSYFKLFQAISSYFKLFQAISSYFSAVVTLRMKNALFISIDRYKSGFSFARSDILKYEFTDGQHTTKNKTIFLKFLKKLAI